MFFRAHLAEELERFDARNRRQPLRRGEEVGFLRRSVRVAQIEDDRMANALTVQGRHRRRGYQAESRFTVSSRPRSSMLSKSPGETFEPVTAMRIG